MRILTTLGCSAVLLLNACAGVPGPTFKDFGPLHPEGAPEQPMHSDNNTYFNDGATQIVPGVTGPDLLKQPHTVGPPKPPEPTPEHPWYSPYNFIHTTWLGKAWDMFVGNGAAWLAYGVWEAFHSGGGDSAGGRGCDPGFRVAGPGYGGGYSHGGVPGQYSCIPITTGIQGTGRHGIMVRFGIQR